MIDKGKMCFLLGLVAFMGLLLVIIFGGMQWEDSHRRKTQFVIIELINGEPLIYPYNQTLDGWSQFGKVFSVRDQQGRRVDFPVTNLKKITFEKGTKWRDLPQHNAH